jgi:hypothetical protein
MVLWSASVLLQACGDDGGQGRTAGEAPTDPVDDSGAGVGEDGGGVCDTECLADRLLAMYLAMEPACRCNGISDEPVFGCSSEFMNAAQEYESPRECVAQYFSEPDVAAELESWIACREERIRTRGPCIMELSPGSTCDQCAEFWDGGGDPCTFLDTDNNHCDLCTNQMMGLAWE